MSPKNQLLIKNFRSWHDENYFDLDRINLFFGPNSSGKSSILNALALLKQTFDRQDGIGNLIPKEKKGIDLGRIEDQISKVGKNADNKYLEFGVRLNNIKGIVDTLLDPKALYRTRKGYLHRLHNRLSIDDGIDKKSHILDSANKSGVIEHILHYYKLGVLEKIELKNYIRYNFCN